MSQVTFSQNLYFDRKHGLLTFEKVPGAILVCRSGLGFTLQELLKFLNKYVRTEKEDLPHRMTPQVASVLIAAGLIQPVPKKDHQEAPEADQTKIEEEQHVEQAGPATEQVAVVQPVGSGAEAELEIPEPPEPPPLAEEAQAPEVQAQTESPPAPDLQEESSGQDTQPEPPPPPPDPEPTVAQTVAARPVNPSQKVGVACSAIRDKIFPAVQARGIEAVASGEFDETIRNVVSDLYRELKPRQVLSQLGKVQEEGRANRGDRVAQATVATQAFGQGLQLTEEELFLLAKSALIYALKEHERENLLVIKRNLLSDRPSPSFRKRLAQSYQQVLLWLKQQNVDPHIVGLIDRSRFIYYLEPSSDLTPEVLALGVADAFFALKDGGERFLIIEEILTERLRRVVATTDVPLEIVPRLITDSCYNEYRASCRSDLGGGDWCAFTKIDKYRRALLIFDVSGHDEEASRIRQAIVDFIPTIKRPEDPAAFAGAINEYMLENEFPDDRFVSLLYGVIDLKEDRFLFTNAGHTPPYLIRDDRATPVKQSDLLLNIAPCPYQTHELAIKQGDCLVFYTDGLTEARKRSGDELFGSARLEQTLVNRKLAALRAKRAVETILKAVNEEGFSVEDDITIQVYRHL